MGLLSQALRDEVGSYDDSEWVGKLGETDVTLLSKPLTPIDMTRLSKKHPNFAASPSLEGMVDLIIAKCRNEGGDMAFDRGDKLVMMRCGMNKISEIFADLFGNQMEEYTEEDLEDDVKK